MSELELKGIVKSFKGVRVLENIELRVEEGEFICLLGPSGSGKSTVLRLIGGFEHPDAGEIWLDRNNITDVPPHKRNIGFVFQDYALFPHMRVEENIAFGLKCRKVGKEEMRERIRSALEMVGLLGLEKRYPKQLSGGQQQRVAIARAIALRPSLLLLDEPLSNLDAKLRRQIRLELRELQKALGITTIMVTHDQEEAMTMGDRIVLLDEGRVQQIGTPIDLYHRPDNLFVAGFLGDPPINFIRCRFETRQGSPGISVLGDFFRITRKTAAAEISGDPIAGIRPEDVELLSRDRDGIEVTVDAVELLGAMNIIHLHHEPTGERLRSLAGAGWIPERGDKLKARIFPEKLKLFDGETKEALDIRLAAQSAPAAGIGG